jgi:hypothetical protein
MCRTLSACYTAAVCTPVVAGIAEIAGVPLVPDVLTVTGLPANAGVPGVVGVHAVSTSDLPEILNTAGKCPETVFLTFKEPSTGILQQSVEARNREGMGMSLSTRQSL